jgi:hypothetical protein
VWALSDAMQTGRFPSPSVQRVPKDVFCLMDTERFDQRPTCCIVRESRCQSRGSLFRQPVSMEMCFSGRASANLDSSLVRFRHESVSNSSPDEIKCLPCLSSAASDCVRMLPRDRTIGNLKNVCFELATWKGNARIGACTYEWVFILITVRSLARGHRSSSS